jgi:hypothetical protein
MSTTDTEVAAEIESKARTMGWMPKDQYKGNPDHWLDAKAYVKKGEEFIPFLRANNRRLEEQVQSLTSKLTDQERLLRANDAALKALQESNNETTRAAAETSREELIEGIEAARREGDVRKEEELRSKLQETNAKIKQAAKPNGDGTVHTRPDAGTAPPGSAGGGEDFTQRQEWKDFVRDNPWVKEDPVMLSAANALMTKMIADGDITTAMTPRERWDKVAEATKKRFGVAGNPRREAPARVEGTRGTGDGAAGGGGSGQSYEDLPQDAKTACDKQSRDPRLVGKGKKYADVAAYRQYYLKMYYGE